MRFEKLEFEKLTVRRDGGTPLLEAADFTFPLNSVVQIYGAQGVGVSSLLQIMAGLLKPSSGAFKVNGRDTREILPKDWYQYQLSIGYGFDHGGLISNCSLLENLTLPLLYNRRENPQTAEKVANDWLERFGAGNSKKLLPALASSASKKACLLARSLILEPELLILDQPTHGLHPEGVRRLVEAIRQQQNHGGLKHIFMATEDEFLLKEFRCLRIEMAGKRLQLVKGESAHGIAA